MNSEKIELVCFDIDGTLFDYETMSISNSTYAALIELKKKNIPLVVATGRPLEGIEPELFHYIDYFIVGNGGAIFDKNRKLLHQTAIEFPLVEELLDFCHNNKINIGLKSAYRCYYLEYGGKTPSYYFANDNGVVHNLNEYAIHKKEDIISFYLNVTHNQASEMKKKFKSLVFANGNEDYYELYLNSFNKMTGLMKILKIENIKPEDCLAFGDSTNDIELLTQVGHGVAMKNGHADLLCCVPSKCEGIYTYLLENKII